MYTSINHASDKKTTQFIMQKKKKKNYTI
jgi:hypothetical protein